MTPSTAALPGAVRRVKGFARYAVSVQYHGGSFLGFTYNGPHREDCVVEQRKKSGKMGKVDLRGHRSVEGRLREALDDLFGKRQWENFQASSRTDRGVHALKNTFHVDIKLPEKKLEKKLTCGSDGNDNENNNSNSPEIKQQHQLHTPAIQEAIERKLKDGLNFYLSRQSHGFEINHHPKAKQNSMMNELRILNASKSPEYMDNPYALTEEGKAKNQTFQVDWNARFSATQRTYVYRILCYCPRKREKQQQQSASTGKKEEFSSVLDQCWDSYSIPFEWDRAWCLPQSHDHPIDVGAMKKAANYLVGTHDFSSFRGRLCQRQSPIVTMETVTIDESSPTRIGLFSTQNTHQEQQKLVTITFVANSFLYRQVRNMVGCLVEVGKHGGKLSSEDVRDLLAEPWNNTISVKDRRFKHRPYSTAPPQGLFLVDVQHANFHF